MSTLEQYLQDFFEVSNSYRGKGEPMTVGQGLNKLRPIQQQQLSLALAQQAQLLTRQIVIGGRRASYDLTESNGVYLKYN